MDKSKWSVWDTRKMIRNLQDRRWQVNVYRQMTLLLKGPVHAKHGGEHGACAGTSRDLVMYHVET
jgi:hypothetical protein